VEETGRGQVLVISGPSGVGKSSVCHLLCEKLPAEFSVSVTTRPRRNGEFDGRDYHYISDAEFEKLEKDGELLETATVYGHRYGTPLKAVQEAVARGRIIVLEIDIKGCIQVRSKMPQARTFFLLPPNPDEQRRRIVGRQTDAADEIQRRLSRADGEIRYANETGCYEQFVVNDELEDTARKIIEFVRA
jgi:guanylate kinase